MWDQLVGSMTLADGATTTLAVWAAAKIWLARPARVLRRGRRQALGPLGVSRAAIDDRCRNLLTGVVPSAGDELSWLADQLGTRSGVGLPFDQSTELIQQIEDAYLGCASRLERGVLFGQPNAPLLQRELSLCHDVAELLRGYADRLPLESAESVLEIPHRRATLVLLGSAEALQRGAGKGTTVTEFRARDLIISYRRDRLLALPATEPLRDPCQTLHTSTLAISAAEQKSLSSLTKQARFFRWQSAAAD